MIGSRWPLLGGTQVQGVVGSGGLNELLTSLANSAALQDTLFSAVTSSSGVMTFNGMTTDGALPAVTVTLEKNIKQASLDFSGRNLGEGDRITLAIAGGSQVQGVLNSSDSGRDAYIQAYLDWATQSYLAQAVPRYLAAGLSQEDAMVVAMAVALPSAQAYAATQTTQAADSADSAAPTPLNYLLGSMASQVASQSSIFSAATSGSGVLTLRGLNDGSALADVTVSLDEDFLYSQFDFRSKNLVAGDRITLDITGGSQVQAVIGSGGLDATLTAMATDIAAQTSLYSAALASTGILTMTAADGATSMPSVTVTFEAGIDQTSLNFSDRNMVEGDRITLNIEGGAQVQGSVGSDGLNALLTTMAGQISAQAGLFSAASASNGVLDIVGLTNGSALANITVTMESKPAMASVGDTDITSFQDATNTLERLDLAVSEVNTQRATFGAAANRLEYAADNLSNIIMNTEASRSRVMDADYAKEATELARTQIIQQVATAMLAQANMEAKQVLTLLEGVS